MVMGVTHFGVFKGAKFPLFLPFTDYTKKAVCRIYIRGPGVSITKPPGNLRRGEKHPAVFFRQWGWD